MKDLILEYWKWSNAALLNGFIIQGNGRELMAKRIYKSGVNVCAVRGDPPIEWEDKVLLYLSEGGD